MVKGFFVYMEEYCGEMLIIFNYKGLTLKIQ